MKFRGLAHEAEVSVRTVDCRLTILTWQIIGFEVEEVRNLGIVFWATLIPVSTACLAFMPPEVSTVVGLPQYGLDLVSSADPEFKALLVQYFTAGVPAEVEPLLPFSVFVRNASEKRVIAYTVRWAKTDRTGNTIFHDQTTWNMISLRGGDALEPKSDHFVSVVFRADKIPAEVRSKMHETFLRRTVELLCQQAVAISLDAAVFADGTIVGSDHSRTGAQVDGRLAAEKDLFAEAAARYSAGKTDLRSFLTAASKEPAQQTRTSNPSQYWYSVYRARTANRLLHTVAVRGDSGTIAHINATLHIKPYPVIHRIAEIG